MSQLSFLAPRAAKISTFPTRSSLPIRKPHRKQSSDPVKDRSVNEQIKECLRNSGRHGYRNYMIWVLATNIGKRGADYLQLRIGDVWDGNQVYDKIELLEHKTNKDGVAHIADPIKEALTEYIAHLDDKRQTAYLFPSQKKQKTIREKIIDSKGIPIRDENGDFVYTKRQYENEPYLLTSSYGYILKEVEKTLSLNIHLRTHSARKTKGYHTYMDAMQNPCSGYTALDITQKMLNHAGKRDTLEYIGITDDVLRNQANRVVL